MTDTIINGRRNGAATRHAAAGALIALHLVAAPALAQEAQPAPTGPAPNAAVSTTPSPLPPAAPSQSVAPAPSVPPSAATPAPSAETIQPSVSQAPLAPSVAPEPSPSAATSVPATVSSPVGTDVPQETAPAAPEAEPSEPAPTGEATLPHDLSPWGMFMAADYVVKAVMIGLAFASVVTWTIWLAKVLELTMAKTRASSGVRRLRKADGLPTAEGLEAAGWKRGPVAALVRAASEERTRSAGLPTEGVKERVAVALQRIEARAGRRMTRGTGLLATIGSTAPFVGLFGTVWGIMNSFIGISQANTTNLAVVAPGIAEALLATAIGLVAAIPAVIVYNVFARAISGYRAVLSDASAQVMQHLSRDLDRARIAALPARSAPMRAAAE